MLRTTWLLCTLLCISSCSSLPSMLNPFSKDKPQLEVNAQVGKNNVQEERTQLVEAKVTSSNTTTNTNEAKTINQAYTNVEPWMVILVALGFGLALPSPMAWYSNRREREYLKSQIKDIQAEYRLDRRVK